MRSLLILRLFGVVSPKMSHYSSTFVFDHGPLLGFDYNSEHATGVVAVKSPPQRNASVTFCDLHTHSVLRSGSTLLEGLNPLPRCLHVIIACL